MQKKKKKHSITLIEMMVVILIIGLISGVLAYNFRKSLDEGKAFKTVHGMEQILNILNLELAKGSDMQDILDNWQDIVLNSALAGKPKELLKDGWGYDYNVRINGDDFEIISESYLNYESKKNKPSST
jgi:general secretion pathway protein G